MKNKLEEEIEKILIIVDRNGHIKGARGRRTGGPGISYQKMLKQVFLEYFMGLLKDELNLANISVLSRNILRSELRKQIKEDLR